MCLVILQAHTCNNMLQLPDYWAALVASEQKNAETRLDPPDLEVELFQLVDERLQTAVTSCCTYELAGPAPEGRVFSSRCLLRAFHMP